MTDETGYRTLTGPDNPQRRRYPVGLRVRFTAATVKQLLWQLRLAWRCGDKGRIRRLTALVGLADGQPVPALAERLGVSEETIYAWLRAFLADRWASLCPRR